MKNRFQVSGFRLRKYMALTVIGILAGCGALPHNRINQVTTTHMDHKVQFGPREELLSPQEDAMLREFLSGLPPLATEEIIVEGRLGQKNSEARLANIRHVFLEKHFPREVITIVDSPEMESNMMNITITTGRVVAPADCPDWSDWSGNNFNNHTYSNFGCATTLNLGQQVAHPYDLLHGTGNKALPDGERNSKIIQGWRSGAAPAAASGSGSGDSGSSGDAAFSGAETGGSGQ